MLTFFTFRSTLSKTVGHLFFSLNTTAVVRHGMRAVVQHRLCRTTVPCECDTPARRARDSFRLEREYDTYGVNCRL